MRVGLSTYGSRGTSSPSPAWPSSCRSPRRSGVPAVSVTFQQRTLPSRHHPPLAYPGRPFPAEVTDNEALWALDAESINVLFGEALDANRATIGLPPPVDAVRRFVVGHRPWLATDPLLDPSLVLPELEVLQTGAWILTDRRPLPDGLEEFLADGTPPVRGVRQHADARRGRRGPGRRRGRPVPRAPRAVSDLVDEDGGPGPSDPGRAAARRR